LPQPPQQAVEARAAAVRAAAVRRPVPRAAPGARLRPAAGVAAGSPAAAVPVAALAARQTAVAPPIAACGWRCRVAVREDGPAGERRRAAECWAQQPDWAQPSSARRQAVLPAASGWQCQEADRHPADGGNLAPADRPATVPQWLVPRCSVPRSWVRPHLA
jgi:hypothetical protein